MSLDTAQRRTVLAKHVSRHFATPPGGALGDEAIRAALDAPLDVIPAETGAAVLNTAAFTCLILSSSCASRTLKCSKRCQ